MPKRYAKTTVVDFSAQFGGKDAASDILPFFKMLKKKSGEIELHGLPYSKVAFILRVEGEVSSYGPSGLSNIAVDNKNDCISVDINISKKDRKSIVKNNNLKFVEKSIVTFPTLLRTANLCKISNSEYVNLEKSLVAFAEKLSTNLFELDDGEARHKEAPATFYLPPLEVRKNLKKGDIVKLIFKMEEKDSDEISVERMWVIVNEKKGEKYIGTVDNDPCKNVYVKAGDIVIFEPRHIIQIDEK